MKTSIIIVTYESEKDIKKCIESIITNTSSMKETEIIIIDNNSNDNTELYIKNLIIKYNQYKIVFKNMGYNSGFAKACNEGAKIACGEKLLFLNPDTEFINDVIKNIENEINDKNIMNYGVIGCKVLNDDNSIQGSIYKTPRFSTEIKEIFSIKNNKEYSMLDEDYSITREVDSVLGAIMYIDKKTYMEIGMLSEDFFMYSEEVELCLRCKNRDLKIYYLESPIIKHYGGKSAIKNLNISKVAYFESKIILYKKIFNGVKKYALISLIKLKKLLVIAKINIKEGTINE